MIRLSFIVPFYNVESYIEECIRSLYDQDIPMEEYEVICVDDCSPDGSRAIVERLQKEYPTLKLLIHAENKRQGGARNTGMKVARGRYVWFVDSDDYIKRNCLKELLEQAEQDDLDILKFHFAFKNQDQSGKLADTEGITSGTDLIFNEGSETDLISRCNSAVQQLIRREFLLSNSIVFAEDVQYEDDDFAYQIYAYAKRAKLEGIAPYIVRTTPDSTTRRQNDIRRVQDIYDQALRMAQIDAVLTHHDARWHLMVTECIKDCINNCVLVMLKGCKIEEQLRFWLFDRKKIWVLKPYLSRKSFVKLSSYVMWRILQR